MTRPKADSDGWLTDPLSRDRAIAKAVVEGLHNIETLLRGIRSDLDEARAYRQHLAEVQETLADIQEEMEDLRQAQAASGREFARSETRSYLPCEYEGCASPRGHFDAHRASIHAVMT